LQAAGISLLTALQGLVPQETKEFPLAVKTVLPADESITVQGQSINHAIYTLAATVKVGSELL
jgi:hypothetical protein